MDTGFALIAFLVGGYALVAARLDRLSISPAFAFVVIGVLLSADFLNILALSPEAESVKIVAEITLALVLFGDASSVDFQKLRRDAGPVVRLLVPGLLLTITAGTVAAIGLFPGISLGLALIIGASLAPTDAALGQPVITDKRVPARIRRILNVESGLNDGIATPFVYLALGLATAEAVGSSSEGFVADALREGAIGAVAGIVVGAVGGYLLLNADRRKWASTASLQLAVLALSLGSYLGAVAIGGNGFIAAFVGGLTFGVATRGREEKPVGFIETQGSLLAIIVWTIFGITVAGPLLVRGLDVRTIGYALISLTLVRMVPVALALLGCRFQWSTVGFIGWFGPRGLASIVFLIIALDGLEVAGQDTTILAGTIGWTVLLSVVLHGLTAVPLARWYGARIAATPGDIPEREASDEPKPERLRWGAAAPAGSTPGAAAPEASRSEPARLGPA